MAEGVGGPQAGLYAERLRAAALKAARDTLGWSTMGTGEADREAVERFREHVLPDVVDVVLGVAQAQAVVPVAGLEPGGQVLYVHRARDGAVSTMRFEEMPDPAVVGVGVFSELELRLMAARLEFALGVARVLSRAALEARNRSTLDRSTLDQ